MNNVDDKMKAAYALNLCTVSVSQIVDFDDINVMEQEYDAILNNLNLEHMPHDEALLSILKQLLDTITFFRIQEGDKRIVDMKYQQKMKNAIWNAVPNFGLIVAGGNLVTMGISLASQIGIGYMNYRKEKAENNIDYEEQKWRLQRTAMEQFNGLQRELFDAAWRLADAYGFRDEMRLSERQIKHYDGILMDANALRRFDRLDSIKENFSAYPPFWYHMGNTANEISRDGSLGLSLDTRAMYRMRAKDCFEKYWNTNKYPLLREDQISSACALEYADILMEDGADTEIVIEYIDKAVQLSGNAWDVLQLCAIGYLRAGSNEKAIPALKILVNENYNSSFNAQVLSGIYIGQFVKNRDPLARSQYEILEKRVNNTGNLLPWPEEGQDIESGFIDKQRDMLIRRYHIATDALMKKFTLQFNKILPVPDRSKDYNDAFFTEEHQEDRIEQVEQILIVPEKRDLFIEAIKQTGFLYDFVDVFNHLLSGIEKMNIVRSMDTIILKASECIQKRAEELKELQDKMIEGHFGITDYAKLQEFTSEKFRKSLFDEILKQIDSCATEMVDMNDFSMANSKLLDFCNDQDIPWPDLKLKSENAVDAVEKLYINYELIGGSKRQKEWINKTADMQRLIEKSVGDALKSGKVSLLLPGSVEFDRYFRRQKSTFASKYKPKTLGIIDDQNALSNFDMLLTTTGVVCLQRDNIVEISSYEKITLDEDADEDYIHFEGGTTYKNRNVDTRKLYSILMQLAKISSKR